jgi:hypothetical protein
MESSVRQLRADLPVTIGRRLPLPVEPVRVRIPWRVGAAVILGWLGAVCGVTFAYRAGAIPLDRLAASPERVATGKVWLLVSNGFIVQRPLVASVVSFGLLAVAALAACGMRVLLAAAVCAHIGATLASYGVLMVARMVDPGSFAHLVTAPDYGVSAIEAGWLGVVAAVCWRRRGQTLAGRLAIVGGCIAVGLFAWMLRGQLELLDTDHVFAFGLGIAVVRSTPKLRRSRALA